MAKKQQSKSSGERTKIYILCGLGGFLVLIVLWNVLGSSDRPTPPPAKKPETASKAAPQGAAPEDAQQVADVGDGEFGPLAPLPVFAVNGGPVNPSRNIFAYPPPPPIKPPPARPKETPPPPTIALGGVSPQTAIAGTSKPVQITLNGNLFPVDSKVYFGGQELQTQFVSRNVLRATIPSSAIASPRSVQVEVKSASQPSKLWSRQVSFQLQPSPDPGETFTYTGRIGSQAVIGFRDDRKPKLVEVGETINGAVPWKILAINDKQVDLLDTRNEIRKTLNLTAKATR